MEALTSRHRPLPAAATCAHLDVGVAETAGRFFPRCVVGTAADRERWAEAHGGPPDAGTEVRGTPAERRGAARRRG